MVTPTTTFRLSSRERLQVDRFSNELICTRSDVLRYGMAALRSDTGLRSQIRADNLARAFLKSLITQYGENAVLELVDGPDDPEWRLAGEPIDRDVLDVVVARQGDRWVMDLVDKATNVAIHNVLAWTDADGSRHAVVPLRTLWVYSSHGVIGEPKTRRLIDGRTVVQLQEDDGEVRHLLIDDKGDSRPLKGEDFPAAVLSDSRPSIGVGVRRESALGPHLGAGFGGKWVLTGDIDADRAAVVSTLTKLIEQAERGDLDGLLTPEPASHAAPRVAVSLER